MIGENAQQMVLEGALDVKGTVENGGYKKEELPEYFSGKIKDISDEKFRILYGREIPDGSWSGEIQNERCSLPVVLRKRNSWKTALCNPEITSENQ